MASTPFITRLASRIADDDRPLAAKELNSIRYALIDTLGCVLLGFEEEVSVLTRAASMIDSPGRASVYGCGMTAATETAAMVNSVAAHSLDMDDWEVPGNSHLSAVVIPALLAAAADRPVSGDEFARAYCAGYETTAALGEANNFEHYESGWHATGTLAAIGAAAAVATLWRLNPVQLGHAISIAVSMAGGLTAQFGSHAKALQAGLAARNGVQAARFAKQGLMGQPGVLEGPRGYLQLTGHADTKRHRQAFDWSSQTRALERYGLVIKSYPSCGYTHRLVDCGRQLHQQGIRVNDIESIVLELPNFHAAILPYRHPSSREEALFSLPYCVSNALATGDLCMEDIDSVSWQKPEIIQLIDKVTVVPFKRRRAELNMDPEQPDIATVTFKSGAQATASVGYPLGLPENPMSREQVLAKFMLNASHYRTPDEDAVAEFEMWPESENIHPILGRIGGNENAYVAWRQKDG